MPYQLYTSEGVFKDNNVNAVCNAIFDNLLNNFTANEVNTGFVVTGSVAKVIQGETDSVLQSIEGNDTFPTVVVVPFVTDNELIYNHLRASITTLIRQPNIIDLTDRFLISSLHVDIEVWLVQQAISIVNTNGIYSQNINEIPNYIY